ncbi:zinc-dependent alcohol dehydrogenase family protein [Arenibacter sp. F26102]|uniref:zinc-dependent alcohol dehydrogenase family protein n=1 Tax=Arenibacter sp. F26102 TaxID=2926416 RepID=UPI001FF31E0A|nr:zinc-dependent alcohol dehydrogenase family protein [Arenibacter sp. F26102]MCK0144914.1 zinc-dependent alcohol dehydrogenase family protein [Arenibacter sp. F26102]
MKAMILNGIKDLRDIRFPLDLVNIPMPEPQENQIRIKVSVCGVCHTELDEIEGRISPITFPVVPGHQVVGIVDKLGLEVTKFKNGDRVGVAWIYSACGFCEFCMEGRENLCDRFIATGKDVNGGYAEYMTVDEKYAHRIPDFFSDSEAAPLLCAGAIGYRSVQLAQIKDGDHVGLTGFGASAHLVLKMLRYSYPNTKIYVFARKLEERSFAMELGAFWAGDTANASPEKLDSIIDTTPAWKPVLEALTNLKKGGRLVINAIRKEEKDKSYLQNLNYQDQLWMEKEIKSVANLTVKDVENFLILAAKASITPEVQLYSLEEANKALFEMKEHHIRGAKVLKIH